MSADSSSPSRDLQIETKNRDREGLKQGKDKNGGSPSSHRKSLSGSFSFFRSNSSDHGGHSKPSSPISTTFPSDEPPPSPRSATGSAMAMVAQQKNSRKRKGSLRKTALLGTGKLRMDASKDRHDTSSGHEDSQPAESEQQSAIAPATITYTAPKSPVTPVDMTTPRPHMIPPPVPMVTHPVHGDPSKISSASAKENNIFPRNIQWPVPGPGIGTGVAQSTASTTSEDESPTSPNPPLQIGAGIKDPLAIADSYFPPQPRILPRPRPTTPKSRSPLAALPPSIPAPPPLEWDYSETRWWGWLILTVTWLVFVVGMGSCFEVWSWAWDVGETPYAPPELEDDPTLPIVGYYPALMVLTSVMAWVWCVVAWVGMKYFKHANISGENTP